MLFYLASRLRNLVIESGIDSNIPAEFAKKISMSNWVSLIVCGNNVLFLPFTIWKGFHNVAISTALATFFTLITPILNRFGYYQLSRVFLVPVLAIHISICDYLFAESGVLRMFLYPIAMLGFLIYDSNERKFALANALFTIGCLLFLSIVQTTPSAAQFFRPQGLMIMNSVLAVFSIGTAVVLVSIFYFEGHLLEKRLEDEKDKLKFVFDQIEEAVLITDENGLIQSQYSKYSENLLNTDEAHLVGQALLKVLFDQSNITDDILDQCETAVFACLKGTELDWMSNSHLFVQEFESNRAGKKFCIKLQWQAIYKNNTINGILLTGKDITKERQAEQLRKIQEQKEQAFIEIIMSVNHHGYAAVDGFFQDTLSFFETIAQEEPGKIKSVLHTLKGTARTLELKSYAKRFHHLEDQFRAAKMGAEEKKLEWLKIISESYSNNYSLVSAAYGSLKRTFGHKSSSKRTMGLNDIVGLLARSARKQAEEAGFVFKGFHVEDQIIDWDIQQLGKVREILLHAVTNSIDHGYVLPAERGEFSKKPILLHLKAETFGDSLRISYHDEGAGISDLTLENLLSKAGTRAASLLVPLEVIFLDGVSSAQALTETSGRGVGMCAIKLLVEEMEGRVELTQSPDRPGLAITIELPLCNEKPAASRVDSVA